MFQLSKSNFEKARDYIFKNADPIDMAWYRYNFENTSTDAFMETLAEYQFDNGGFGGLVHEFEYAGPCLKCTEHAFRYIYFLKDKPDADHPVIQKMMRYILERYRPEIGCWGQLVEPEVNDGLHVSWWTYEKDDRSFTDIDERIREYEPNGHAALAAFVALYSDLVPEDLYQDIIRYPIEKVLRYYDRNSNFRGQAPTDHQYFTDVIEDPYNMKCLQQFCDCLNDKKQADILKELLKQSPAACMELDESIWYSGYREKPSDVVITPDSFLYAEVKDAVDRSLDSLIDNQSADGSWHLTFRFGSDEGFRKLEAAFDTHFTMLNLAELNRFGRIEMAKPYYTKYEDRYQAVYKAGADRWGYSPDDAELNRALAKFVQDNDLVGKKIIDFACGEGADGVILSKLGCSYYGVDISPSAIENARATLRDCPNAQVELYDMVHQKIDGAFDAALDVMGFHMLVTDSDRARYLKNAFQCLKDGAPMLFYRESYREDASDEPVATYEDWVSTSKCDCTTPEQRFVTQGDKKIEVHIPLMPCRAKNRDGYNRELKAAGFIVDDIQLMDASNQINYSATIYVHKP